MPGFAWSADGHDDATPVAITRVKAGEAGGGGGGGAGRLLWVRTDDGPGLVERVDAPPGCRFEQVPVAESDKRTLGYVYGAAGAGKSYWIRTLAAGYLAHHRRNRVFLISALDSDDTLDALGASITRIPVKEVVDMFPGGSTDKDAMERKFKDSLLIADDIEGLSTRAEPRKRRRRMPEEEDEPKAISEREAVYMLLDHIATKGRHWHTTLVWAAHLPSDGHWTRTILSECQYFVVYPSGASPYHTRRMLTVYGGVGPDEVDYVMGLPDRWVQVFIRAPRFYVCDSHASLIKTALAEAPTRPSRPTAGRQTGPPATAPPPATAAAAAGRATRDAGRPAPPARRDARAPDRGPA